MNTRYCIKINQEEKQDVCFKELPKEVEEMFREYMEESRHFQEITQLYQIFIFDFNEIFSYFRFRFDDSIASVNGEKVNIIQLNALLYNAISASRTLVESIEVYDREYVSKDGIFKKYFISSVYDECFAYRFVDFLRNYMQHGHIPVSFDGEKIFFHLSEILNVLHMKINQKLRIWMQDVEIELQKCGSLNTQLAVVPTLYQYFLQIHVLGLEFFKFVKSHRYQYFEKIINEIKEHPEWVLDVNKQKFVGVYIDEFESLHGFWIPEQIERELDLWIIEAQLHFHRYMQKNEGLSFLYIQYCLENRMPVVKSISEKELSTNLADLCCKMGKGIHHLSFDDYYGKSSMHCVRRLYPFIQYEDGVKWNVPYTEVTIGDFFRTFPNAREKGLKVYANNVASAGEFFERLLQDRTVYFEYAKTILKVVENVPWDEVIDWAVRIEFIWKCMKKLKQSFAKEVKKKPTVKQLRFYISQKREWNIDELAKNLHADKDVLEIVLRESGYICQEEKQYIYDEKTADKLEEEREKYSEKLRQRYGANRKWYYIKEKVEALNADILYFAVTKMEQGNLNEFDEKIKEMLFPLKGCQQYVFWNHDARCICINEDIPEDLTDEEEEHILNQLNEVWDSVVCQSKHEV